jgi:hypothetical protein
MTVKSQALADFIAEWTDLNAPSTPDMSDHWLMFFDGSLNINGASVGILFVSPNKDKLRYVLRILFPASHNVAEYEAIGQSNFRKGSRIPQSDHTPIWDS